MYSEPGITACRRMYIVCEYAVYLASCAVFWYLVPKAHNVHKGLQLDIFGPLHTICAYNARDKKITAFSVC